MDQDIVIVRDGEHFRVLHGHLHLIAEMDMAGEVVVEVRDEGVVKIVKSRGAFLVNKGNTQFPLH